MDNQVVQISSVIVFFLCSTSFVQCAFRWDPGSPGSEGDGNPRRLQRASFYNAPNPYGYRKQSPRERAYAELEREKEAARAREYYDRPRNKGYGDRQQSNPYYPLPYPPPPYDRRDQYPAGRVPNVPRNPDDGAGPYVIPKKEPNGPQQSWFAPNSQVKEGGSGPLHIEREPPHDPKQSQVEQVTEKKSYPVDDSPPPPPPPPLQIQPKIPEEKEVKPGPEEKKVKPAPEEKEVNLVPEEVQEELSPKKEPERPVKIQPSPIIQPEPLPPEPEPESKRGPKPNRKPQKELDSGAIKIDMKTEGEDVDLKNQESLTLAEIINDPEGQQIIMSEAEQQLRGRMDNVIDKVAEEIVEKIEEDALKSMVVEGNRITFNHSPTRHQRLLLVIFVCSFFTVFLR